jgi:hypothetical protein
LHHSVPYEDTRCNYGNSLILCDRIFGTYKEGEASVVGQDDRRRLSIREQWVFPFVPLFKAWQSRRANAQTGSNGVVYPRRRRSEERSHKGWKKSCLPG